LDVTSIYGTGSKHWLFLRVSHLYANLKQCSTTTVHSMPATPIATAEVSVLRQCRLSPRVLPTWL
jgi:hypothetical protein